MSESLNRQREIAAQAVDWYVQIESATQNHGSVKDESAEIFASFEEWLCRSPEHVKEFMHVMALNELLTSVGNASQLSSASESHKFFNNVFAIADAAPPLYSTPRLKPKNATSAATTGFWHQKRVKQRVYTGVAFFMVFVLSVVLWSFNPLPHTYQTEIGEQKTVILKDGSVVSLNTNSSIRVMFNESQRSVYLLSGEAIFEVVHDGRPFIVHSDEVQILALGTKFNVYRQNDSVVVTVVEGKVSVQSQLETAGEPTAAIKHVELVLGEQVVVGRQVSFTEVTKTDLPQALAWTQKRLVFEDDPIQTVIQESNRYNKRQLRLVDSTLQARRISAVFNADDQKSLIAFLQQTNDLQITRKKDLIWLCSRGPQPCDDRSIPLEQENKKNNQEE